MNSEIKMSVSGMTRKGEEKAIYVLFSDGDNTAEYALPGCKLLRSSGFSEDDLRQLRDYLENEQDAVFAMAKEINPLKAFMGK